jgi:hypothetical protein
MLFPVLDWAYWLSFALNCNRDLTRSASWRKSRIVTSQVKERLRLSILVEGIHSVCVFMVTGHHLGRPQRHLGVILDVSVHCPRGNCAVSKAQFRALETKSLILGIVLIELMSIKSSWYYHESLVLHESSRVFVFILLFSVESLIAVSGRGHIILISDAVSVLCGLISRHLAFDKRSIVGLLLLLVVWVKPLPGFIYECSNHGIPYPRAPAGS